MMKKVKKQAGNITTHFVEEEMLIAHKQLKRYSNSVAREMLIIVIFSQL